MKTFAILLLAGNSTRFVSSKKKQFFILKDKPVFLYSLETFENSKYIDEIIVVANESDLDDVKQEISRFKKVKHLVQGGQVRQESVKNGLDAINEDGYVLIHDAARPLVDEEIISSLVESLKDYEGVTPAIKVVDTIVKGKDGIISSFEDRDSLYRIQTPQAFRVKIIKLAHQKFADKNASDDTTLLYMLGKKVKIVEGKEKYKKITKLEDIDSLKEFIK